MTDTRWIFVAQAGRAFGYGLAAVLLGSTLAASGLNATQVGLLLAAIVAGTVLVSIAVGAVADGVGRRRTYLALYALLAVTGVVFAATSRWPALVAVALVGVLSTEVVESGPFTLVYWLQQRYGASTTVTGMVMFALGVLQTLRFLAAPRLAHPVGLLRTMVFTHLPSNVLLAAVAFAPNLATAIALLLARAALSQMDVPTRQAYVMALVPPAQRTRAAAVTNTARYLTRPAGTALLGPAQLLGAGLPFLLAGAVKTGYDLVLWAWFRHVQPPDHAAAADAQRPALATGGTP